MLHYVEEHAQGFPKMWYFSIFKGFKPELLAVKVGSNLKKKILRVATSQKKDTASIFRSQTSYEYNKVLTWSVWYRIHICNLCGKSFKLNSCHKTGIALVIKAREVDGYLPNNIWHGSSCWRCQLVTWWENKVGHCNRTKGGLCSQSFKLCCMFLKEVISTLGN